MGVVDNGHVERERVGQNKDLSRYNWSCLCSCSVFAVALACPRPRLEDFTGKTEADVKACDILSTVCHSESRINEPLECCESVVADSQFVVIS